MSNRDWQQATGSDGFGGSSGFRRPMRNPVTRELVRPFAGKAAAPPRSALTASRAAHAREVRRLLDRQEAAWARRRDQQHRIEAIRRRALGNAETISALPRTAYEAVQRGIDIHRLRELQRQGLLPLS